MLIFHFLQYSENQRLKLWGLGNLKIFHMIDINQMVAIFQFFYNGRHWYSVDTGKTADVNFLLVQFSELSVGSVFPITHPRLCFNINAWLCLNHFCVVTFLHLANQRHKFSIGSVFPINHLRFRFNIYVWLCIKHSCMDIYAWWPFCTSKKCPKNPPK